MSDVTVLLCLEVAVDMRVSTRLSAEYLRGVESIPRSRRDMDTAHC